MESNFKGALAKVLKHEGGFVNHPKDPGGATNRGVTLTTYRTHFGVHKTVDDLKRISEHEVETIYRSGYWRSSRCDELPAGVDYAVFDVAVNSGVKRGAMLLQAALGLEPDGVIGSQTLEKVREADPVRLIDDLCTRRLEFLRGLKHWPTFKGGWTTRVEGVRRDAMSLAAPGAVPSPAASVATHRVTANANVNLRAGPSTADAVLAKLPTGTGVTQLEAAPVESDGHRWVKVRATVGGGPKEGWVASRFLTPAG